MPQPPSLDKLQRNATLYPWYEATVSAMFWLPVFFLYFTEQLSLQRALQLEAIYYTAIVVTEVPSGYFSDVVGRRVTLIISALLLLAAYVLFVIDDHFAVFAAAQVCLAAGFAFHSGTNTAFHNDTLAAANIENQLADREAIVSRNSFAANAVAALVGGLVAVVDLRLAYVCSAVAALAGLGIAMMFVEPHEQTTRHDRFVKQVTGCFGFLRQPILAWLFAYAVCMTVLNHVPYEFFQSYIDLSLTSANLHDGSTTVTTGVHVALTMCIGSFFAARSVKLSKRVGLAAALLIAMGIQVVMIGAMASMLSVWLIPLILLRSTPRALMTAPLNAAVAPRVPTTHRATYLSIQSLAGRLGFAGLLLGLSTVVGEPVDWPSLALLLRISAALAVGLWLVLTVTRSFASRS